MSATTDMSDAQQTFRRLQYDEHRNCFVCSLEQKSGLGVRFEFLEDGGIKGTFGCDEKYQGYPGQLQGGVIATLLDSIMTNYLFAKGVVAVTAELTTRFRHPVKVGQEAELFAHLERQSGELYLMAGQLYQEGQLRAEAKGKFVAKNTEINRL